MQHAFFENKPIYLYIYSESAQRVDSENIWV